MNMSRSIKRMEEIKRKVKYVLNEYSLEMGCPCSYRPFVYWAGKKQGPGWQDSIQNQLVKSTLELNCFELTDDRNPSYEYKSTYVCNNCETVWDYFSYEWRMLAFQERLVKSGGADPDSLYDGLIAASIFATVGHEPHGRNTLSIDQWVAFMQGRDFKPAVYKSFAPPVKKKKVDGK